MLPLTHKELFIAGLFLYWGEGNKGQRSYVSINNTDPQLMRFALLWLREGLHVPEGKIRCFLHLCSGMDVEEEIDFWCGKLGVTRSQFYKPYIKVSTRSGIKHKGYGHGAFGLQVNNTELKERIMTAIQSMGDYAEEKLRKYWYNT